MVKYENKKQRRQVSEFMDNLLLPLKNHLKEEEREFLDIALRIIRNTDVEEIEVDGDET